MEGLENKASYLKGLLSALVCEDNQELQKIIVPALKDLRYRTDISINAEDALKKIKFNQYNVIVINEKFAGKSPETNEVLRYLKEMPMTVRRHIFLALLGKNLPTQDNMAAFERSANVVISEDDISNFKDIVEFSVFDNEQFYKVYKESLVSMGKR